MKNIIVLGINPFSGNRGVGALAFSIIYLLDKISIDNNVSFNILIPTNSKIKETKIIEIASRKIAIKTFPFLIDSGYKGLVKILLTIGISYKELSETSYILDIGEGDSFSDIYGEKRFFQINTPKKIFRFLRKKQLLLPQTIGPFRDELIKKKANKSIENSNVVLVRDKISYDYVLNETSQKNVKELIDIAFFMPYTKRFFSKEKINVGLNISSLLWHGGYTQNNQFGFKGNYHDIISGIIEYFLGLNVQLYLVPHVMGQVSEIEDDYTISQKIIDEYNSPNMVLAPFFLDPIKAKNYISGLDFFIGARMHACIAAFSSNVPVYPIAYSRKFNGLFVDSLKYPFLGDLKEQNNEELIQNMKEAFNNRYILKENIEISMKTIVESRYNSLISELKYFLDL